MNDNFQHSHVYADKHFISHDNNRRNALYMDPFVFNSILDIHGWLGCPWHQLAALKRYMLKKWNA
ncbi:MAG: hypothetical protein ACOX6Y_10155 [Christensenellales bacterium]|jgi:hypothetical protein